MADEQDKSQKTEEATPKRLEDARKKGQVPHSREPSSALAFLMAASLGITGAGAYVAAILADLMRDFLSGRVGFEANGQGVQALLVLLGKDMLAALLPIVAPILVLGVLVTVLITGPVFSFEAIIPKWEKISPVNGFKRLFSSRAVMELIKSIAKLTVISLACWFTMQDLWPQLFMALAGTPQAIAGLAAEGSLRMAGLVAVVFFFIAALDVFYQRYEHAKSLRMSQKELRDEHKESEGDPHVKARIRRIQSEQARQRMMSEVPKADVVITNPTHIAVALAYRSESRGAPRVVAKGKGKLAEKIKEIARAHGVPVRENKPLARSLFAHVKLGSEIPEHLYEAVAVILAEIYRMRAARRMGA